MSRVVENVKVLDTYVTSKYLTKLFKRSELTITMWRKNEGLPYIELPGDDRPAIRYVIGEVLEWAKRTGRRTFSVGQEKEVSDEQ